MCKAEFYVEIPSGQNYCYRLVCPHGIPPIVS